MTQEVTIAIGSAKITVPAEEAVRAFLDQLLHPQQILPALDSAFADMPPRIGRHWPEHGGIYAGIVRGDEGQPDYYLIVLGEHESPLDWKDATKWCENVGGALPKRKEQAVMFGNVPELFEKTWYWSCEPYAGLEGCAWYQRFGYGSQYYDFQDRRLRARAVRRVPLSN